MAEKITISVEIDAPLDKVWDFYNSPMHVTKWNNASPDWHSPRAQIDLREGGKFSIRMEAKDQSAGFDFGGVYDKVEKNKLIEYTMGDKRKVSIVFAILDRKTQVKVTFDPENENPLDFQKAGWQSILNNFKTYTESH